MKTREFQALLLLFSLWLPSYAQPVEKPNIVIILADDLGWGDVGYHGSEIKTPNIDRLAREGVILDHFYTTPICSPTRAGLMTGRYPNRFGLRQTVIPPWSDFGVDTSAVFLPEMLARTGYRHRAALGKWHLGHAKRAFLPLQRGFTHFYGHYNGAIDYFTHEREGELDWHRNEESCYDEGYTTDLITQEAVSCIKTYAQADAPFFLYVAYNAPHAPLQAKQEDLLANGYQENQSAVATKRQTYAAMVSSMDEGIGDILSALAEMDIDTNTLVLFFSDNGAETAQGGSSGGLRGAKFLEWEGGTRAPAIIKWPAGFVGGRILKQVTGYIDVVPTLREIAGSDEKLPAALDGVSIWSVLSGARETIDREFYLGYGTLVTGNRWKVVKADAGNAKMDHPEDLLFDIQADPREQRDLKQAYPAIYRKLLQRVTEVYDEIHPGFTVAPFGQGREGFTAPPEWKIKE
ncbi:arylsulfatase [Parapedobacter sp. DT-150]